MPLLQDRKTTEKISDFIRGIYKKATGKVRRDLPRNFCILFKHIIQEVPVADKN